jgi:hypothetical protein
MIGTALALAAMLTAAPAAGPQPVQQNPGSHIAAESFPNATRHLVLSEMAPAPGHWEVEDAPAYFRNCPDIADAPAPGEPSVDSALGDVSVTNSRP